MSQDVRAWCLKAHKAFDPLWQRGRMTRIEAYALLGAALGGADQAEVLVVGRETESMRRRRLETAAVHRAH